MAESLGKRLRNFFGFDTQKKKTTLGVSNDREIVPTETDKEGKTKRVKFDSEVKRLWDWYLSQTSDSTQTLSYRWDRYKDLEYMAYNDTIISSAVDLYADEASQVDNQMSIVTVTAKKTAVAKDIEKLLNRWGIDQSYIRECAWNLVLYGDSFDVVDYSKEHGVESIIPVDVHDITERIEFKASEIAKMKTGDKRKNVNSKSIQDLIDSLDKINKNSSKNFKSYLLGFKVGEEGYLPPWGVNHYRLFSRRSEFFPYGRSMFIHLIAPYRQLKTSKNLMALTRALKFPKEIFEVKTDEGMSELEKWDKVNQARQEYENNGMLSRDKEDFSVGGEVWVPDGLISHNTIENNLRIEDIADIELLRDDLIMGTRIPKGYLIISDRGSFGTSGQSLLQQSKPFGRAVFTVQSAILQNIAHLIRLHFLMTGQHQKEFTEFQLGLHFPVVEEAQDRLRMKQDTLRLAKDVIDNFQTALGFERGEAMPPEVVKMVFSKLSFLTQDEVEEIVSMATAGQETPDEEGEKNSFKEKLEKYKKRFSEDTLYASYFDSLKTFSMKEGLFNGLHSVTSNSEFIPEQWKSIYNAYRSDSHTQTKLNEEEETDERA